LTEELRQDPTRRPPSLAERDTSWYPEAVVPFLCALARSDGAVRVVNLMDGSGIVREVKAAVAATGMVPLPAATPSDTVRAWIERFVDHERAVLAATLEPSDANLREALSRDPVVARARVPLLGRELLRDEAVAR
jgi:alpha-galactosidase/6-phospho-beta-glucosidase family protein